MRDTSYYFKHDYNSRLDPKIKSVIRKHGYLGFGVFWALIEDLYNQANAMPLNCEDIADDMRVDESLVKSVIYDFGLFVVSDGIVSSKAVQRRLDDRDKKSEKAAESAKRRWEKSKGSPNGMRSHTEGNARKEIREEGDKSNVSTGVETEKKPTDVGKESSSSTVDFGDLEGESPDDVPHFVRQNNEALLASLAADPVPPLGPLTLEWASEKILEARVMCEEICMIHHIGADDLRYLLETFVSKMRAKDYKIKSEKDVKDHFSSWVTKFIEYKPDWKTKQNVRKPQSAEILPEEVQVERDRRLSRYQTKIAGFPEYTGRQIEFPESLSKFHVSKGFFDELRSENIQLV